ncbi:MAG: CocE/NonD family hydrolase [Bacteroidetes bacterium]|nr:CocE/NonD family hydrolase [Bacteroidota bacterium]
MKNKILTAFIFVMFLYGTLFSQTVNESWIREHYTKKEYQIPMRDGAKLFTAVYMPKDQSGKHPFIMTRTPYACAPYGEDKINPRFWLTYWGEYLKRGYIFVIQDVRGRFMSEGTYMDVRPFNAAKKKKTDIDEASDTYDAVDWLVKNIPDNNGNVGVFGISYPGFYSTMAALSGHPAIKAVSPQAPVTEWFMGDDFHHNGVFMLNDAFNFYTLFGQPRHKPTTEWPKEFKYYTHDNYKFYLETGALKNFSALMGDSIAFWTDLMNHPNYDDWWKARDARRACLNVKPAMLVVGGLFDAEDCFGAWNLYKAIEKQSPQTNNKLVMGPWFHGGWAKSDGSFLGNVRFGSKTAEYYQQNLELPFFEYYLRGKGTADNIHEANIFFTGEDTWHSLAAWPPAETVATPLYLQAGGKLDFTVPSSANAFTQYTSDPAHPVPYTENVQEHRTREYMCDDQRFASRRTDVLTFQTNVLSEDLTLAGVLTADLKVAISTTDADFVVKLIDVFPDGFSYDTTVYKLSNGKAYLMDGYQMLVRGEIMRGRFRNSYEKPEAFEPGKVTTVKFNLPDVAHTFKKGHRLMVQIQSTWFPLADRNPQQFVDIYHCSDSDFKTADIKIFHQASDASSIVLPVLKK